MNKLFATLAILLLLVTAAVPSSAQTQGSWDAGRPQLTRAELTDLLARLDELAQSTSYGSDIRGKAREEAVMVRSRLERGDIRVGDQIELVVEGEESLSKTFAVRPGEILTLPGIGDVSVGGVLRSELESHLRTELAKYIRDPVVQAQSLVRVTITGSVGQPGFYGVQASRLLSDAIMVAGGPGPTADLNSIRIVRSGADIWSGKYLQQAIADGRTLDQLSLQAGDQIIVPARKPAVGTRILSIGGGLVSVATLVVMLFR